MNTRIQNMEELVSTGNVPGRKAMVEILEAGLQGADPYENTKRLMRLEGDRLIVGREEYEPVGSPRTGEEVFDLSRIGKIYVFGAGKGMQRVAKAFEDVLGDRLTGGHVVDKKGHPIILDKIEVTLGGHPAPDEDCARGCARIIELARDLDENDLVFTCVGNGVSSLMTMPVPGVSMDDLRTTTYVTQVQRGTTTGTLSPVRNHLDMVKGGRISRYIHPAKAIHVLAIDPGHYGQLIHSNLWLHTLPDYTDFQLAIDNLKKEDAWDAVPESVRNHLQKADPKHESVKAEEFERMWFRIFGVMPGHRQTAKLGPAMEKAEELGFKPVILTEEVMGVEARDAGLYVASIARTIERTGGPFEPPCALFGSGELVVTVGNERGMGGRNQEFALSAARGIAGSRGIIVGSVDTDGTDGPGAQFADAADDALCLSGGIVDGTAFDEAGKAGIDIAHTLKTHDTSPALRKLSSGVVATPNISLIDLTVVLVMGRSEGEVGAWHLVR